MPPPMIAIRPCLPFFTAAHAAIGPLRAATPTAAPPTLRKSRRLMRIWRRSCCTDSTVRPERSASLKSSKSSWKWLSNGVRAMGDSPWCGGSLNVRGARIRPSPSYQPSCLRDLQAFHHLLVVVVRVRAVVERADGCRVVERSAGRVAEIVPYETGRRIADAEPERRVQLRVPRVPAQADVVA